MESGWFPHKLIYCCLKAIFISTSRRHALNLKGREGVARYVACYPCPLGKEWWLDEFIHADSFFYNFALNLEQSIVEIFGLNRHFTSKFSGVVGLYPLKYFVFPPNFSQCLCYAAAISKKIFLWWINIAILL